MPKPAETLRIGSKVVISETVEARYGLPKVLGGREAIVVGTRDYAPGWVQVKIDKH